MSALFILPANNEERKRNKVPVALLWDVIATIHAALWLLALSDCLNWNCRKRTKKGNQSVRRTSIGIGRLLMAHIKNHDAHQKGLPNINKYYINRKMCNIMNLPFFDIARGALTCSFSTVRDSHPLSLASLIMMMMRQRPHYSRTT